MTKPLHQLALTRLTNAELAQFITHFLEDLDKLSSRYRADEGLVKLINQLKIQLPFFRQSLEQVRASDKTLALAKSDRFRDDDLKTLGQALKAFRLSKRDTEQEAYLSLSLLFKQYRSSTDRNYEAQTALVASLLEKLATAPYQEQVTLLGLNRFVANLAESNAQFSQLYASRSQERLTKVSYNTKALRQELLFTYNLIADYINVTAQVKQTKPYTDLLPVVNHSRKAYADLLARKPKNKTKKGDKEVQGQQEQHQLD